MRLTKTPLPGGLMRFDLATYGLQASVIEAARWLDKRKPDTRQQRSAVACLLLSARQQLRERAASEGDT